jgi:hypothetical protein
VSKVWLALQASPALLAYLPVLKLAWTASVLVAAAVAV